MTRITNRRLGKFHINADLVLSADAGITRIMGACAILRAENNLWNNTVEYHAISFKFRELPECEVLPEYTWIIHDDGSLSCEEV